MTLLVSCEFNNKTRVKSILTQGVLFPYWLQNVTWTLWAFPVLSSKLWHSLKGGEYKWSVTAVSEWLGFSTRCRPIVSVRKTQWLKVSMKKSCILIVWSSYNPNCRQNKIISEWCLSKYQNLIKCWIFF